MGVIGITDAENMTALKLTRVAQAFKQFIERDYGTAVFSSWCLIGATADFLSSNHEVISKLREEGLEVLIHCDCADGDVESNFQDSFQTQYGAQLEHYFCRFRSRLSDELQLAIKSGKQYLETVSTQKEVCLESLFSNKSLRVYVQLLNGTYLRNDKFITLKPNDSRRLRIIQGRVSYWIGGLSLLLTEVDSAVRFFEHSLAMAKTGGETVVQGLSLEGLVACHVGRLLREVRSGSLIDDSSELDQKVSSKKVEKHRRTALKTVFRTIEAGLVVYSKVEDSDLHYCLSRDLHLKKLALIISLYRTPGVNVHITAWFSASLSEALTAEASQYRGVLPKRNDQRTASLSAAYFVSLTLIMLEARLYRKGMLYLYAALVILLQQINEAKDSSCGTQSFALEAFELVQSLVRMTNPGRSLVVQHGRKVSEALEHSREENEESLLSTLERSQLGIEISLWTTLQEFLLKVAVMVALKVSKVQFALNCYFNLLELAEEPVLGLNRRELVTLAEVNEQARGLDYPDSRFSLTRQPDFLVLTSAFSVLCHEVQKVNAMRRTADPIDQGVFDLQNQVTVEPESELKREEQTQIDSLIETKQAEMESDSFLFLPSSPLVEKHLAGSGTKTFCNNIVVPVGEQITVRLVMENKCPIPLKLQDLRLIYSAEQSDTALTCAKQGITLNANSSTECLLEVSITTNSVAHLIGVAFELASVQCQCTFPEDWIISLQGIPALPKLSLMQPEAESDASVSPAFTNHLSLIAGESYEEVLRFENDSKEAVEHAVVEGRILCKVDGLVEERKLVWVDSEQQQTGEMCRMGDFLVVSLETALPIESGSVLALRLTIIGTQELEDLAAPIVLTLTYAGRDERHHRTLTLKYATKLTQVVGLDSCDSLCFYDALSRQLDTCPHNSGSFWTPASSLVGCGSLAEYNTYSSVCFVRLKLSSLLDPAEIRGLQFVLRFAGAFVELFTEAKVSQLRKLTLLWTKSLASGEHPSSVCACACTCGRQFVTEIDLVRGAEVVVPFETKALYQLVSTQKDDFLEHYQLDYRMASEEVACFDRQGSISLKKVLKRSDSEGCKALVALVTRHLEETLPIAVTLRAVKTELMSSSVVVARIENLSQSALVDVSVELVSNGTIQLVSDQEGSADPGNKVIIQQLPAGGEAEIRIVLSRSQEKLVHEMLCSDQSQRRQYLVSISSEWLG